MSHNRTLALVRNPEQEVEVQDSISTSTLESEEAQALEPGTFRMKAGDGEWSAPCTVEQLEELNRRLQSEPPRRPDYGVIDRNTGEMVQMTLLGAEWDQYQVESLRLSLSGGDDFAKDLFDQLVTGGELSPGSIVEVVARGIVKEHAPIYGKDGHEGKTVITLQVVRSIHVLGHMKAKVEAGQNVDGEPRILEGGQR